MWYKLNVELQVFRNTENMENSRKLSTKRKTQKMAESNVLQLKKE